MLMAFTVTAEVIENFPGLLMGIEGGMLSGFTVSEVSFWISLIIDLLAIVPVTCTSVSRNTGFSMSSPKAKDWSSFRFVTSLQEIFSIRPSLDIIRRR